MRDEYNVAVASRLDEVADLLEEQGANPYRVAAYRRAAERIRVLDEPVAEILHTKGLQGLMSLRGIGESIARSVHLLVVLGRLPMLERLRGESDPEALLRSVPGIGEKRLAGIRDVLANRLGRLREPAGSVAVEEPVVAELLDVDREYREKAAAGVLHRIAPRRFNPTGKAWLSVLHTRRGTREYTALFSNSARAHRKGRTRDWVVLYYDDGDGQSTVITATRGLLRGRRIVVGRLAECERHYETVQPEAHTLAIASMV